MSIVLFFFFNDTATTEIYTLSLHDALPICRFVTLDCDWPDEDEQPPTVPGDELRLRQRSEEHTSELQSPCNLVCRLLLEKKKKMSSINRQCSPYHLPPAHHTSAPLYTPVTA